MGPAGAMLLVDNTSVTLSNTSDYHLLLQVNTSCYWWLTLVLTLSYPRAMGPAGPNALGISFTKEGISLVNN